MRLLSTLVTFLALATLFASPAFAQDKKGEKIVLVDGSTLFVDIVDIKAKGGLSVKWNGMPMQIEWKMLDATSMKGLRLSKVDEKDEESFRLYGKWCKDNGLMADHKAAAAKFRSLFNKAMEIDPVIAKSDLLREPDGGKEERGPKKEPDEGKKNPEPTKEPKKETPKETGNYRALFISAKGAPKSIIRDLSMQLREVGVEVLEKKTKGAPSIKVTNAMIKKGKHPNFMGSTHSVEFKGVASLEIIDGEKNSLESKDFDTGMFLTYPKEANHLRKKGRTTLAADEKITMDFAQKKARDMLISSIISWARAYLPRSDK